MRLTCRAPLTAAVIVVMLGGWVSAEPTGRSGRWLTVSPDDGGGAVARSSASSVSKTPSRAITLERTQSTADAVWFEVHLNRAWLSPAVEARGKQYSFLSIPGCGNDGRAIGQPDLPFKGFFVEVPFGGGVNIEITRAETVSLGQGYRIRPEQRPEPDDGSEPTDFAVDEATYARAEFLPELPVSIGEPSVIRGRRVVFVQVFPIQYNPQTGELRAFRELAFQLVHAGQPTARQLQRKRRLATPFTEASAKRLIANYQPASDGSPDSEGTPEAEADGDESAGGGQEASGGDGGQAGPDGADYLIIVKDALYDEVLPLASWKYKKGLITRVLLMSEVGTTADDVGAVIQNAYDTWVPAPRYVLLVGDAEDIPPAYYDGELECDSDQLFACVDGTDYFPDLAIGRLPVQTTAECAVVVSKILAYDRTPQAGDWYSAFLSAGYFQDENYNGIADRWFMETSAYSSEFLQNTVGLTRYTAWCKDTSIQHDDYHYRPTDYPHRFDYPDPVPTSVTSLWSGYFESASEVSAAINAGVGFVLHRDHGTTTSWGAPPFYIGDVQALSNGSKTPILFSINCKTGTFDRTSGDCFCEAFLKHNAGGAVGAVGSTRNSYSGYNDLITHGLMTCFWPSYDPTHTDETYPATWEIASALTYGKYYMHVYEGPGSYTEGEFYMFHWFGDPEMTLRTSSPVPLSVDHPIVVDTQMPETVTVTVMQEGSPLEGARVCIAHEAVQDQWQGLTGPDGTITFSDIVFQAQADYSVVVTAINAMPYEGVVTSGPAPLGQIALDRDAYSDNGTVTIEVSDRDMRGTGEQAATVTTSAGDSETVALYETEPDSAVFVGTISTAPLPITGSDGTLQVAEDQTITASYYDEDDGTGNPNTVEDTAIVDTTPPIITGVETISVNGLRAVFRVTTDTPTTAAILCGTSCGGPYTVTGQTSELATDQLVTVDGLEDETAYVFVARVWDRALNEVTDDNGGSCYAFTTPFRPDYFTQGFEGDASALSYRSITLIPDGSPDFYRACAETVDGFFVTPLPASVLPLGDNTSWAVSLSDGKRAWLYGAEVAGFRVSSNGCLNGTGQDATPLGSYDAHFSQFQISALFADLDPSVSGSVSFKQLDDRAVVTWLNVPEKGTLNLNSIQAELFFDGRIRLTYLAINASSGVVGISAGGGTPEDFLVSDLLGSLPCDFEYLLDVNIYRNDEADVIFEPEPNDANMPSYPPGTEVTLSVLSEDPEATFRYWQIYDPNHPGDGNYAVQDSNETISLVMDGNQEVYAVYACGDQGAAMPLLAVGLLLTAHFSRRRRGVG